jgi:hypothetical protein
MLHLTQKRLDSKRLITFTHFFLGKHSTVVSALHIALDGAGIDDLVLISLRLLSGLVLRAEAPLESRKVPTASTDEVIARLIELYVGDVSRMTVIFLISSLFNRAWEAEQLDHPEVVSGSQRLQVRVPIDSIDV